MDGEHPFIVKLHIADAAVVRRGIGIFFLLVLAGIMWAEGQVNVMTGYYPARQFINVSVNHGVYTFSLGGYGWQGSTVYNLGELHSEDRDLYINIHGHTMVLPTVLHFSVDFLWHGRGALLDWRAAMLQMWQRSVAPLRTSLWLRLQAGKAMLHQWWQASTASLQ